MKKSYYCKKLETTLHFLPDKVNFCCTCAEGAGCIIHPFAQTKTTNPDFNLKNVFDEKNKFIKMLNNGQIPPQCEGCTDYTEKHFKEKLLDVFKINKKKSYKISHIIFDHWKECDCNCIYCSQKKLYKDETKSYELLNVIKQCYKNHLIDKENLKVEFQGGSISLLKEFEPLMNEFKSQGCEKFIILMNGIRYMPILEQIACTPKNNICISLDAGSKETFYKIKQVDAFDLVIENIKKLRKKSCAYISLKYIIVKDVNDNHNEVKKFLNIVKEIGNINAVSLEIDYNNTFMSRGTRFDVPKHYFELFEYAENFCKANNIYFYMFPYTKDVLNRGYSI